MTYREEILTPEQKDFLNEMMNVGAGNAATALSQIIRGNMDIKIPKVILGPPPKVVSLLEKDPSLPVTSVRMDMCGQVKGELYFIVPDRFKNELVDIIKQANPGSEVVTAESTLLEIGNIVAGVYLTAVNVFCGMNIFHTIPTIKSDMILALLDETIATKTRSSKLLLVVENEFIVSGKVISTYFILIPYVEFIKVFTDSIVVAQKKYGR